MAPEGAGDQGQHGAVISSDLTNSAEMFQAVCPSPPLLPPAVRKNYIIEAATLKPATNGTFKRIPLT